MGTVPIGSMCAAIYGNIYHQYTRVMLANIYHTWILWVYINKQIHHREI